MDQELSSWYKDHSRVFVASDHACWADPDLARKVQKRRFGTVVRSAMRGLNRMMSADADAVQDWILANCTEMDHGDTTEEEKA